MSRLWPEGEPIVVQLNEHEQPARFTWRGRAYRPVRIHQQWEVDADWWRAEGRIWRSYLALTTSDGLLCVIYQDLEKNTWYLAKVYD
jgi:hypothetical protein